MGFYIQTEHDKGKAEQITALYDGMIVPQPDNFQKVPASMALIVVVDNGPFEAAGLCYSEEEFAAFTDPGDRRSKKFVLIDWDKACELTRLPEKLRKR